MRTILLWLLVALAVTGLTGCASMLLGGGGQTDSRPSTSSGAAANSVNDQAISRSVRVAFERDEAVRQYAIGVGTNNRVVTLSGTVGSYVARDRAVGIARGVSGVRDVRNRIVVNTNL